MSIYTRTGDKGKTSMFSSNQKKMIRISKASIRVHAIGSIDEVNSYLGISNFYTKNKHTKKQVKVIQTNLFTIGSILSKAPLKFSSKEVGNLEKEIDRIEEDLPPLRNFLMPEGSESAVHFMYARALTRRAERRVVKLSKTEKVPDEVLIYLNRLSDYLFCIFREENMRANQSEEIWVGRKRLGK